MRFIRLDENNRVISVRIGAEIVEGEIQSDIGECGQIMQADGTFINPELPEPQETQLDRIETTLDLLLLKQEGIL
jgi:hypothetical protein